MIKKVFLIIFLYVLLFLLSVFTLYLYISFSLTEQVIGIFPNIKEISNIIIFIYVILLFFLFLIVRKKEKYIIISIGSYFAILFISLITFYFGYFKKDIFELVDIPDDKFITKYQNIEIKDEENIYTYLFNLKNSEYKSKTLFGKYKEKLEQIQNNENYKNELSESEKLYECYLGKKNLELCNGLSIDEYLKDKNYPSILEQTKTFTNILQIINKHNIYKTKENLILEGVTTQLRSNFYYLLVNSENKNNKEVINYFQQHYRLFSNILNGDITVVEYIVSISSIKILNEQMNYVLDTFLFSEDEKEQIKNIFLEIKDNFHIEEIYANTLKNEYKNMKLSIDTGVILGAGNLDNAPQNFLYNYNKTMLGLKNIYYFKDIKRDPSMIEKLNIEFGKEKRLSNLFRYNIFGNYQLMIAYISFDGYFEELENLKNEFEEIIKTL